MANFLRSDWYRLRRSGVLAGVVLFLLAGTLGARADQEALALAEESVRRAAVQCYALEGAYPQDLSHLEERYGVSVDADRFRVDYIYIASNLMPDITIVPLSGA